MYKGEANWTLIGRIEDNPRINIPIFGNGDVDSPEKAKLMRDTYGVDGIMIGRATIGYPWIFNEIKHYFRPGSIWPHLPLRSAIRRVWIIWTFPYGGKGKSSVVEMRRHYANYFKGFHGFKEFRMKLVTEYDPHIIKEVLNDVRHHCTIIRSALN